MAKKVKKNSVYKGSMSTENGKLLAHVIGFTP
jgi:hypothetical protein